MLRCNSKCPAVQPKAKFWHSLVKNRKNSAVKHSIEKPILLNFVNLSPTFCPRLYFRNSSRSLIFFAKRSFLLRCLGAFWIPLCIYKCYVTRSFAYSSIFKHYPRAYSHISRTFSIPGRFNILTYSKVRWYSDPCQTYCSVLWKIVPGYNHFCKELLFRPF